MERRQAPRTALTLIRTGRASLRHSGFISLFAIPARSWIIRLRSDSSTLAYRRTPLRSADILIGLADVTKPARENLVRPRGETICEFRCGRSQIADRNLRGGEFDGMPDVPLLE